MHITFFGSEVSPTIPVYYTWDRVISQSINASRFLGGKKAFMERIAQFNDVKDLLNTSSPLDPRFKSLLF